MYFKTLWLSCVFMTFIKIEIVHSQGWIYRPDVDGWIKPHKVIATYDEAEELCDRDGSVIASPITKNLLTEIRSVMTINNHRAEYYIGVKAKYHPRLYETNGISIEDMPVTEMIERIDPAEGDCLAMRKEIIRVVPCNASLPYICYRKKKDNPRLNSGRFKNCRTDYLSSNRTESCYKVHLENMTWYEAHFVCHSEGSHLAIVNSYSESLDIMNNILPLYGIGMYHPVFIGWRYANNKWTTIFGDLLEDVYHDYLKNHEAMDPACATIARGKEMSVASCDITRPFLCEVAPTIIRFPLPESSTMSTEV